MIIRDYLICLLQMYLLEDLEKNILPYRRERFWEKFLVYCIAALAMFGTNRLESSILNMVMIPVIYMIASMVVFRGNMEEAGYGMLLLCAGNYSRISLCGTYECIWRDWCVRGLQD